MVAEGPPALVPEHLRVALPEAEATGRGFVVDLPRATGAPTIDEAPVRAGMLLAQRSLFSSQSSPPAGEPYLMTAAGAWRQFDLARYGLRSPTYGGLATAIAADGRSVAFADPSGLVVVDLRDNSYERFELPVHHAVALDFTADASTLLFKDRNARRRPCGPTGCALDLATGRHTPLPYDHFDSAAAPDGTVVEVAAPTRRTVELVSHRPGRPPSPVPLDHRASVAGGPVADRHVAFPHCVRGKAPDGGVMVADPTSGEVIALLADARRVHPWGGCRLAPRAWLSDTTLVVDDWTSGDMWLWDVPERTIWPLAAGRTPNVNYDVAREVLAERLASG